MLKIFPITFTIMLRWAPLCHNFAQTICILYALFEYLVHFVNALLEYIDLQQLFSFKTNKKGTFCQNHLFYWLITMLSMMICSFSGSHCTNRLSCSRNTGHSDNQRQGKLSRGKQWQKLLAVANLHTFWSNVHGLPC